MKILDSKFEDGMIHITIDNKDFPEFTFRADNFDTVDKLKAEIEKCIARDTKKISKYAEKSSKISDLLITETKANATN